MRIASAALHLGFLVTSFALGVASSRQSAQSSTTEERVPVAGSTREASNAPAAPAEEAPVNVVADAAPPAKPAVREEPSVSQIAARAQQWTAAVRADQNYGAGIIMDRMGLVLTNQHVVDGTHAVAVTPFGGEALAAEVLDSDAQLDIALLRLPRPLADQPLVDPTASGAKPGTPALPAPLGGGELQRRPEFALTSALGVGDEVLAVGSPRKMYFSVSRGMVSYVNRYLDGVEYIQTDLPINVGNSGGPLVDRQGRVVGVVSFILRDSQGISFALPIERALTRFSKYFVAAEDEAQAGARAPHQAEAG